MLLVFVSENYYVLSLHLSSLIQLEGLCGTKCKKTTSDSLIRRLPPFISQHISIIGHYVLCNITLRDKSGDAIRNQSQFVHRNRLKFSALLIDAIFPQWLSLTALRESQRCLSVPLLCNCKARAVGKYFHLTNAWHNIQIGYL